MPLTPMNPVLETRPHWWLWDGHEINLNESDPNAYPKLARAAVLAHRDAESPEDLDAAAYLAWAVEEHPPWNGGCTACGAEDSCDDQRRANGIALEFLIRRSTDFLRSARATAAQIDQKRTAA